MAQIQSVEQVCDRRFLLLEAAIDFGLTPSEFKVFFHLVRFLDHSQQSIRSIAQKCELGRTTVIETLFSLQKMGMIRRSPRGRSFIYEVAPLEDWVERKDDRSEKQTRSESKQIQNLDYGQEQPAKCTNPLRVSANESHVVPIVESEKQTQGKQTVSNALAMVSEPESEPEFGDVFTKVEAARKLGCNIGTSWVEGVMMVAVNGALLSVQEFMDRSLSSFKELLQPCEAGLNLCRKAIAQIKQKIATAKATGTPA